MSGRFVIEFSEGQLQVVLSLLDDVSAALRSAVHAVLGSIQLTSPACLYQVVCMRDRGGGGRGVGEGPVWFGSVGVFMGVCVRVRVCMGVCSRLSRCVCM